MVADAASPSPTMGSATSTSLPRSRGVTEVAACLENAHRPEAPHGSFFIFLKKVSYALALTGRRAPVNVAPAIGRRYQLFFFFAVRLLVKVYACNLKMRTR
jgi:hypothetical protein